MDFYYYYYMLLKSIYIIFYITFSFIIRFFIEIYIDTIKYKPFSEKGNKYIVYILDRYFNYQ